MKNSHIGKYARCLISALFVFVLIALPNVANASGPANLTVFLNNTPYNVTATSIDSGSNVMFSAIWTGGTSPYTVNYVITNSITGTTIANMLYTNVATTYNSFRWSIPAADTGNTITTNVIVTDASSLSVSSNAVVQGNTMLTSGFSSIGGSAFTPNGLYQYISNFGSDNVIVVNTETNTIVNSITSGIGQPQGIAVSPSGTYAYVANYYGNVAIINTATQSVVNSITGFSDPVAVAFAPSGSYAYVTNHFNTYDNLTIINTATNAIVKPELSGLYVTDEVSFLPDGKYAYVNNFGFISAVNAISNTIIGGIGNSSSLQYLTSKTAIAPSGTYAYIGDFGSKLLIMNTATDNVIGSIKNITDIVGFAPDGAFAYGYEYPKVVIINTATNTVISSLSNAYDYETGTTSPTSETGYYFNYLGESSTYPKALDTDINPPLSVALISSPAVSNTFYTGNSINLIASWSGGVGPYTVNYTISNPITHKIIESLIYSGITTDSNTLQLNLSRSFTGDTLAFNATVTDSASLPSTSNSTKLGPLKITLQSKLNTPTPLLDQGQNGLITALFYGGEYPFTIKWYSGSSPTCSSDTNLLATYSSISALSNSLAINPTSSGYYCETVSDSSTPVETNTSGTVYIAVNPALSSSNLSPNSAIMDEGQSIQFSSNWIGGSPTYSASLYSSPTSTCNQQSALVQQQIGLTSTNTLFNPIFPASNTYYCAFITDGAIYTLSGFKSIRFFNFPTSIAISPSGTYAYVTSLYGPSFSSNSNVSIIDLQTNTISGHILSGFYYPYGVAFSPSGTYAYVTNDGNNNVVIINTASNTVVNSITSGFKSPDGVAFSPSGTYAYVTNYLSNNIVIINTASNTVTGSITSGFSYPEGVAFSPSGAYAYVTNCNASCGVSGPDNVVIINTASNAVTGSITSGFEYPAGVAFSPSGAYAYVGNMNGHNLTVVNAATNTIITSIAPYVDSPSGIAFSPSGAYAYVANEYDYNVTILKTGIPSINSLDSYMAVNPAMTAPSLSASVTTNLSAGQYETFTSSWSGGTSPYAANYQIFNTTTGALLANALYTGITATSNAFSWQVPSIDVGNTISAKIIITDSATVPFTINSIPINSITIPAKPKSTVSVSNPYAGGPTGFFGTLPTTVTTVQTTIPTTMPTTIPSTVTTISIIRPSGATAQVCNGTPVSYTSLGALFSFSSFAGCLNITAENATSEFRNTVNSSEHLISAINYTIQKINVTVNVTLNYPCGTSSDSLNPSIFRNGTWSRITPFTINATACTITFAAPADPVIGLFNVSKSATVNITSILSTTINTTTIQEAGTRAAGVTVSILIIGIIAIVVIVAVLIYLKKRVNNHQ